MGNNLAYYLKDKYEVSGLYSSHPVVIKGIRSEQCDLINDNSIKNYVCDFNPSVIIHCASLTNIDQCETDQNLTRKINVLTTKNIVEAIADKDIKLVYISTDAVYDGGKGNFSENDPIGPQNYYGISKYEGEMEVLKNKTSLVLRTNLFGWNIQDKKSLGEWILEELKADHNIKCFKDAYFSSIYTFELARVIDIAIQNNLSGIYNCGSSDACSKYEFAIKIAECFGLDTSLVTPIYIDDFYFKAKRGKNLTLNVNSLQKELNYRLPTIDQSIEAFYRDYRWGLPGEIKKGRLQMQQENLIIPYGKQYIDENDIQGVISVLRSDRITQGPAVEKFEKALAEYCGVKYAVAMNSATSALHAAGVAAGLSTGDEAITSPVTFVASANCVVYCDAKPIFADIDSKTYNIDPKEIENKINSRTKAVIPVHFAGQSCDMESIQKIVRSAENKYGHKIYIIEDACHALGSIYKTVKAGSCTYSDMTVMSFHPVKHITTGEGGMVLTNDETLYQKLKKLRSHGIVSTHEEFINADLAFQPATSVAQPLLNPWYYEQIDLGYNYRLTDLQSALGLSQLKKLDMFRRRRKEIVSKYNAAFRNAEFVTIPFEDTNCDSNFHLYVLLFDFEKINIDRARFMIKLKSRGIQTQVHYIPVYFQPYYQKRFGTKRGDCPNAERYYQKCLSIPLFPAMSDQDVNKVIKVVTNTTTE